MKVGPENTQPIILSSAEMDKLNAREELEFAQEQLARARKKFKASEEERVLREKIATIFFDPDSTPEEKMKAIKAITPPDNELAVKTYLIFLRQMKKANDQATRAKGKTS